MPRTKKEILQHLQSDVYCKIGVSKTHGVGVFAIREIPKGAMPLRSLRRLKEFEFPIKELKKLPREVKKQVEVFCFVEDGVASIPSIGLNSFDMAVYLNHSKKPNLRFKRNGSLEALKRIRKGEELFIDYDVSFGATHTFK